MRTCVIVLGLLALGAVCVHATEEQLVATARAEAKGISESVGMLAMRRTMEVSAASASARKSGNRLKWNFRFFISKRASGVGRLNRRKTCKSLSRSGVGGWYVGDLPPHPTANYRLNACFSTDNRHFSNRWSTIRTGPSSRGHITMEMNLRGSPTIIFNRFCSKSHNIICTKRLVLGRKCGTITCSKRCNGNSELKVRNKKCLYNTNTWKSCSSANPRAVVFWIEGEAADPCVSMAPKVNFHAAVGIDLMNHKVSINGRVDEFPWYESYLYIDNKPKTIFRLSPKPGKTAFSLIGGAARSIRYTK